MNTQETIKNSETNPDGYTLLCAVCSSSDRVEFLTITDCNLCNKCQDDLSKGFEEAMKMDRSDYPEL